MRNEGPFVLDWLAHLGAVGISDFLIYTNDCEDGTDLLLDRLGPLSVTHVRHEAIGKSVQWRALQAARRHPAYERADWVTVIDCDEFPVPKPPFDTLCDLIDASAADAIILPWRLFGSGGQLRFEDLPVPDRFIRAAPERMLFPAAARFFKTLFRRSAFARPGVHRPKTRNSSAPVWIDGSGRRMPETFARNDAAILMPDPDAGYGQVQLNHYSLRSAEDFIVKRWRGLPNRGHKPIDASYWAERNFNAVEDRSADRYAAQRAEIKEAALALPGVADAHASAITAHRARIERLLRDPEEARLFTRLALLRDSVPPNEATGLELLRLLSAARGDGR